MRSKPDSNANSAIKRNSNTDANADSIAKRDAKRDAKPDPDADSNSDPVPGLAYPNTDPDSDTPGPVTAIERLV